MHSTETPEAEDLTLIDRARGPPVESIRTKAMRPRYLGSPLVAYDKGHNALRVTRLKKGNAIAILDDDLGSPHPTPCTVVQQPWSAQWYTVAIAAIVNEWYARRGERVEAVQQVDFG